MHTDVPARRRRLGRTLLIVPLTVAVTSAGFLVAAGSALAVGGVHFVDGGTAAPAATLGGYSMTPFGPDPQPVRPDAGYASITSVASPLGGLLGFSAPMTHLHANQLQGPWGNGYAGDTYFEGPAAGLTITLPADTAAFSFYALGDAPGTWNVTAVTDNGTTSGAIPITGTLSNPDAAHDFGFYTDDGSAIASIKVTIDAGADDVAVGEFGISKQLSATPVFSSAAATTFTSGSAGSFAVTTQVDAAHGVAKLTCPGCSLPNGVSLVDNGDGTATLSGTPGANTGGVYMCSIEATNSVGTTTQTFTLTVNQAPSPSGSNNITYTVGSFGSYTYAATGYPGVPTISVSSGTLPSGIGLAAPVSSTNGHGDKVTTVDLKGTPAAGSGGTYTVGLVAANGTLPDATETVHITVYEAPTITSADSTTFTALHSNAFQVTTSGGYPPSPVTFTESGALPSGVTLSSSGLLSGNPPVWASGYWTFTITASDGFASSDQMFTLFVQSAAVSAGSMADPGGLTATTLNASAECVSWQLTGYAPYAPVTVIAYPSTGLNLPTTLGTFTTNGNGRYPLDVCLPGNAHGAYTLLAAGYTTNGSIHYLKARTVVQP